MVTELYIDARAQGGGTVTNVIASLMGFGQIIGPRKHTETYQSKTYKKEQQRRSQHSKTKSRQLQRYYSFWQSLVDSIHNRLAGTCIVGQLHLCSKEPERGTLRTPMPVESGQMHYGTSSWPQRSKRFQVLTRSLQLRIFERKSASSKLAKGACGSFER
jgi:hypothetical protein